MLHIIILFQIYFIKEDVSVQTLETADEELLTLEPPDCWENKQVKYFTEEYSWLFFNKKKLGCTICKNVNHNLTKHQGTHSSKEWVNGNITPVGNDVGKQQSSLRKKIAKHKSSQTHLNAERTYEKQLMEIMPAQVLKTTNIDIESTKRIFRTAYSIAKNQRPYVDMPKLVDLQIMNGLSMGRVLQTNKSCSTIIDHICFEMRKKLCSDLLENKRKICIIVDESTTLSQKTMLVICLRAAVVNNNEVITFFFNIIEVESTSADCIRKAILVDLSKYGLNEDFLKENLIAFVSDGASNMLGRISGVGTQLQKTFPDIIVWHCCNHRLELAVSDTLKEIHGTNDFQSFIEKLYAIYHQSPKNMYELRMCATSLEQKLLHIGKIFTIRWVASSEKTLKAVWNNYVALYNHFTNASNDTKRESKERSKYTGLRRILTAVEFVINLGK